MSLPGRGSWLRFFRGGPITAVTAPGTLGAPTFRIAMLRLPAWVLRTDRGKNHDPAAMTPDLTSASRRARSRQDHAATRGPAARLDPISARRTQGVRAGTKSGLQAEQKATFALQRAQRLKNGKTTFQPNQKTTLEESVSRTTYALRPADIFTRYRHTGGGMSGDRCGRGCQAGLAGAAGWCCWPMLMLIT